MNKPFGGAIPPVGGMASGYGWNPYYYVHPSMEFYNRLPHGYQQSVDLNVKQRERSRDKSGSNSKSASTISRKSKNK